MLLNEFLNVEAVTREEWERYQLFRFFEGQHLPEAGGLDDQSSPVMASLRKVSFVYSLSQAVLEIRDERARQSSELYKLTKIMEQE
jgi:hypothetical protein